MDGEINMKKKKKKVDEMMRKWFDRVPHEIVIDILSRLPITSLLKFTLVSPSLSSLSHDPHLLTMHLSRSSSSPCLIFHSDYPIQNHLHFLQFPDHKLRKITTPFAASMPEFTIIGSSNGLLCLVNSLFPESIYLYNPFTRLYRELPKNFSFQNHEVVYGFGSHPITGECKVIKIAHDYADRRQVSEVEVYCNTWKKKGILNHRLEKYSSPGVDVGGRLHWLSKGSERPIVSFDLADESFQVIKNPGSTARSCGRWVGCNLGALRGCLCAVVHDHRDGCFDIWVMKEMECWVKEHRVGVYRPVSIISHKMETSSHIWRNMFSHKVVKILCVLESGEVVLEYRGGGLVCYDLETETFKEVVYDGMPRLYQTVLHVGSLKSV